MCANRQRDILASMTVALVAMLIFDNAHAVETSGARIVRFLAADGAPLERGWPVDCGVPTYLVVHGFNDSGTSAPCLRQAAAIQRRFPTANVAIVDWVLPPEPPRDEKLSWALPWEQLTDIVSEYTRAVRVSTRLGREIAGWMKERGIQPSMTVVSGHSLGAQIAAFVSNECAKPELFGEPVRAIVAADPAGPLFVGQPREMRLDSTDADQVIVVHATEVLGDKNAIGAVDVYVSWPESDAPDVITQHSLAREFITQSFLQPALSNVDGSPFGINTLGAVGREREIRTFRPDADTLTGLLAMREH
ncbi:MAG: hypothetical protein ISR77_15550 [Pirellulaceae bacterium]|nr:hypothetical protein [Pirellulaceae bacterium]